MRIGRICNTASWNKIWINMWQAPLDQHTKAAWYKVLHDILPTRTRLHTIRLAPNDCCRQCEVVDSLPHRSTVSGEGTQQWEWTCFRLALMLRTDRQWIPDTLMRPVSILVPTALPCNFVGPSDNNRLPYST
jgi:hypothetical protein